jgi:hypothetical protein
MDTETKNTVELSPDGYIEAIIRGDQSYLSFDLLKGKVGKLVEDLQFQKKPILGLIDLTEMKKFNSGSNKAAFEILETVPYQKIAIFGSNSTITAVTSLVLQAIGKSDRSKIFKDKPSALAWLLS